MRPWTTSVVTEFRGMSPFEIFKTFLLEFSTAQGVVTYGETVRGYTTSDIRSCIEAYPKTKLVYVSEDPEAENLLVYSVNDRYGFLQVMYSDTHVDMSVMSVSQEVV